MAQVLSHHVTKSIVATFADFRLMEQAEHEAHRDVIEAQRRQTMEADEARLKERMVIANTVHGDKKLIDANPAYVASVNNVNTLSRTQPMVDGPQVISNYMPVEFAGNMMPGAPTMPMGYMPPMNSNHTYVLGQQPMPPMMHPMGQVSHGPMMMGGQPIVNREMVTQNEEKLIDLGRERERSMSRGKKVEWVDEVKGV